MSTDYFLFVRSDQFVAVDLPLISQVNGVALLDGNELEIEGLIFTYWEEMDDRHRAVMREEYGKYGMDFNWFVTGRYDKKTCVVELTKRLVRCAAMLISARPHGPLSLMRNTESFYVFNSPDELILSKVCFDEKQIIPALFNRPYTVQNMVY